MIAALTSGAFSMYWYACVHFWELTLTHFALEFLIPALYALLSIKFFLISI